MMNLELNQTIGMSFFDFVSPEYKNSLSSLLDTESWRDEITLRTPDNTTIPAFIATNKLHQEKSVTISAVITDLTQQKRNEENLRHREHLEQLVAERTHELRDLAHRLVDAQEKERAVIGISLHDEIGQLLTYTTLLIDKAARKPDPKTLEEAKSIVQEAISKIRDLSSMLSPNLLRSAGLEYALASLIEDFSRRTKITVDFKHRDGLDNIQEEAALACYRIVQESLTNILRYAKATGVKIQLSRIDDNIRIEVEDNGIGFEPERMKKTTGITGMRERAVALGGYFNLESSPGKGTHISTLIPVSERKQE
jgi:signal transduction histidine kinase